jgi:hypothetical protein
MDVLLMDLKKTDSQRFNHVTSSQNVGRDEPTGKGPSGHAWDTEPMTGRHPGSRHLVRGNPVEK